MATLVEELLSLRSAAGLRAGLLQPVLTNDRSGELAILLLHVCTRITGCRRPSGQCHDQRALAGRPGRDRIDDHDSDGQRGHLGILQRSRDGPLGGGHIEG